MINPDRLMKPLIADRRITETKRDKFWDHSCERAERTHAPLSLRSKQNLYAMASQQPMNKYNSVIKTTENVNTLSFES